MTGESTDHSDTEFELPFGGSFRVFELGFFAVLLTVSFVFLVLAGVDLVTGGSPGVLRPLLTALLGSVGGLLSVAGGLNVVQLLRDRRPALLVSPEGILNRTYWNATTLVPWDEVVDVRRTRYSWILEVVLRDPEAFRSRQIFPIRVMMRITSGLGIGPLPVYLPQFAASRDEVSRRLFEVIEARELASIREQRRLEATSGRELPTTEPERRAD